MKQFTQNRFLVLLVAILLTANLGLMLYFFVFRHKEPPPVRPSEYMQKKLGLNTDQAAKFQKLTDQHKEAVKPVINDMRKLKDSLYNLLQQPNAKDSEVTAMAVKIGDKQKQLEIMIFRHFQRLRAVCDSSQLPKFDTLVHRMVNRGPGHKKRPGDR